MTSVFSFYLTSLLIIYVVMRQNGRLQLIILNFGDYLQLKAFPSYSNLEHLKFSVLRPLFGLILLLRAVNIHKYLTPEDLVSSVGAWSVFAIIAAILLLIGLFTQYSLLFLIFFMWHQGDGVMATSTLGNDVGAMLAVLLFLTSAGRNFSIDSLMVSRFRMAGKILLYSESSFTSKNIALVKFSALASYWAICVYSVSLHINEPAWMTGVAGPLLLTNNFMSTPYQFFESIFVSSEVSVNIARYSLWLMMLWYPAILPLTLLGGWWRRYVIVWGLLFLVFCIVILNLGSLAEIEFIFFAAIFWSNIGISSKEKLSVYYDDKCNLCDKTIQVISILDIFGRIKLKPISDNKKSLQELNINLDEALNNLYGVVDSSHEINSGYNFYIMLSKKVFLLWLIFPILILGKLLYVGPVIYKFIAMRRRKLFGACGIPRRKFIRDTQVLPTVPQPFNLAVIVHIILLIFCYLIFMPAPYVGITGARNVTTKAAHLYGVTPINVFNKTDLRMAENWFTLKSIDYNQLIPIFTEQGTRLEMHQSDRIYFGYTLRFRRGAIGRKGCLAEPKKLEYLSKVYLSDKHVKKGVYTFQYRQYYQALPDDLNISHGVYKKNEIEVRCELEYKVSYKL